MADNVPDVYVRLHDLKGECTDLKYPGEDGWVQIKSFSFSFGLKNSGGATKTTPAAKGGKPVSIADVDKRIDQAKAGKDKKKAEDDGPFDRPAVTIEKTLDLASASIWKKKCHSGEPIAKVEVVACRYGGERGDEKIPFLSLIFENVVVKSISLGLSNDELPGERIQFRYDCVKMKYIWTANTTGSRVRGASAPRAGWNFQKNVPPQWGQDE